MSLALCLAFRLPRASRWNPNHVQTCSEKFQHVYPALFGQCARLGFIRIYFVFFEMFEKFCPTCSIFEISPVPSVLSTSVTKESTRTSPILLKGAPMCCIKSVTRLAHLVEHFSMTSARIVCRVGPRRRSRSRTDPIHAQSLPEVCEGAPEARQGAQCGREGRQWRRLFLLIWGLRAAEEVSARPRCAREKELEGRRRRCGVACGGR